MCRICRPNTRRNNLKFPMSLRLNIFVHKHMSFVTNYPMMLLILRSYPKSIPRSYYQEQVNVTQNKICNE